MSLPTPLLPTYLTKILVKHVTKFAQSRICIGVILWVIFLQCGPRPRAALCTVAQVVPALAVRSFSSWLPCCAPVECLCERVLEHFPASCSFKMSQASDVLDMSHPSLRITLLSKAPWPQKPGSQGHVLTAAGAPFLSGPLRRQSKGWRSSY